MGMGFAPTWLRQVSPLLHTTTLTTGTRWDFFQWSVFPAFTRTTHARSVVLTARHDLDIVNIVVTTYIIRWFIDISYFFLYSHVRNWKVCLFCIGASLYLDLNLAWSKHKLAPRRVTTWKTIQDGALMNLRKLNTHYTLVAHFRIFT